MAHPTPKKAYKDLLWNVSLLPIASTRPPSTRPGQDPPEEPAPNGGTALRCPALLSVLEAVSLAGLDEAA
jgi:hypothetical protein